MFLTLLQWQLCVCFGGGRSDVLCQISLKPCNLVLWLFSPAHGVRRPAGTNQNAKTIESNDTRSYRPDTNLFVTLQYRWSYKVMSKHQVKIIWNKLRSSFWRAVWSLRRPWNGRLLFHQIWFQTSRLGIYGTKFDRIIDTHFINSALVFHTLQIFGSTSELSWAAQIPIFHKYGSIYTSYWH